MEIKSGIYRIINIVNGKFYIGSSKNLEKRKKEHFRELKANKHANAKLQHAYNKYGKDSFKFEILEHVVDVSSLLNTEQKWLDKFKTYDREVGYNIAINASAPMKGRKHTEETKKRFSEMRIGDKNYNFGKKMPRDAVEKMKIKISGKNSVWYGRKHTKEELNKMSKSSANKKDIICIETGKEYESITKAANNTGCDVSALAKACKNKGKTVGGYHWAFLEDWNKNPVAKDYIIPNSRYIKVYCIELDMIFDTMKDAAKHINVYPSNIGAVINGKQNTTKGYHFVKYNEWINHNSEKYIRKDRFKTEEDTIGEYLDNNTN